LEKGAKLENKKMQVWPIVFRGEKLRDWAKKVRDWAPAHRVEHSSDSNRELVMKKQRILTTLFMVVLPYIYFKKSSINMDICASKRKLKIP
jgi:hypothetical protein